MGESTQIRCDHLQLPSHNPRLICTNKHRARVTPRSKRTGESGSSIQAGRLRPREGVEVGWEEVRVVQGESFSQEKGLAHSPLVDPPHTHTQGNQPQPDPYPSHSRPARSLPDCRNGGGGGGGTTWPASCWFRLLPEFTPSLVSSRASPAPPMIVIVGTSSPPHLRSPSIYLSALPSSSLGHSAPCS